MTKKKKKRVKKITIKRMKTQKRTIKKGVTWHTNILRHIRDFSRSVGPVWTASLLTGFRFKLISMFRYLTKRMFYVN